MLIGTDIIEIKRFKTYIKNENFLKKVYTQAEIDFLAKRNVESYAVNFCGKEAVAKAFKTGFGPISANEIEILRDGNKAPYVVLHGRALNKFNELNLKNIEISLSHCKEYAVAFVVVE